VLLAASAWFQPAAAASDLWWHLASGRELWKRGPFALSADPFSYTFGGREWMNHEWLWDVLYWPLIVGQGAELTTGIPNAWKLWVPLPCFSQRKLPGTSRAFRGARPLLPHFPMK